MQHLNIESDNALMHAMKDTSITAKAKTVLFYASMMGEGYDLTVDELKKNLNEGKRAIGAAIKSLEDNGYLERTYSAAGTGRFHWDWTFNVPKKQ